MSASRAAVFGSLTLCAGAAWGHEQLCPAPHGALPPLSPGVPFSPVSAVCLVPQVYNQNTSKSVIVE